MNNRLKTLIAILLSAICLYISLFVFEKILQFREPQPKYPPKYARESEFVKFFEYDPLLGWKNKPGVAGQFYMPDSKSYVRINSNAG